MARPALRIEVSIKDQKELQGLLSGGVQALTYPAAKTIHLVVDNLNIHSRKSLADVYGTAIAAEVWDRFRIHYTPTHGSWLNPAEIEIGIFSRPCLGKRRIPNLKTLRRE